MSDIALLHKWNLARAKVTLQGSVFLHKLTARESKWLDLLNILRREREFCLAVKKSGILGVFDGSIALPSQKYFIEAILSETMEGNPRPRVLKYQVQKAGSRSCTGGVFIDEKG